MKKSLSTRTHACSCGCTLDRDENAARNILRIGLRRQCGLRVSLSEATAVTSGHCGTWLQDSLNAWGELTSTLAGEILSEQVGS